ncbi:hypothetical protein M947_11510 [Sulfurimonas hongkongensis]|uniref:Uncharacterized protein n=1 Tax=Sulfurimonas hongkongensis TaxID=1172190 RepID=T0JBV5_9BACT|nr:hypothetical protein [Sulfurimonas hongkongensis]EQB34317.1 hypothetical protein M947_11510 [Sulfurimonas hongkongensis]
MSKKIFKYVFIATFAILLIVFISLFKPATSFFIERYTSNLLEQKVKINSLNLTDFSVEAYIQDPQNKIEAKLITLSPLKIEATFDGDIGAFKKYHSLRGDVGARAIISYDEKIIVDAKGTLYDAKIDVKVEELGDNWLIGVNAKALNIDELKKQNSLDFGLVGVVDFMLSKQNKDFTLSSSLKSPKLGTLELDAKGKFEDKSISTSCSLALGDKRVHLKKLLFDLNNDQISVSTKEFGGELNFVLKDEKLSLDAKTLHIEKLLEFMNYKDIASGVIDIDGEFDTKSKKGNIFLTSPKILGFGQEIKNIKFSIPALQFLEEKLSFAYTLDANILERTFNFEGDLSYKETLHIVASSSEFKSKSSFELNDKEIKVSVKQLDIKELLDFFEVKPFALGVIDLDAKGDFEKFIFHLNSDAKVSGLGTKVSADGFFITDTKELNSKFKLYTKLGKEEVKVKGTASYKQEFKIVASSSNFGANSNLLLKPDKFEFYTKNLDLQKLSKAFDEPNFPFGKIDFLASEDFENIALNIRSKELRRNTNPENISDYISFDLSGTYKDNTLSIKDKINLHHKRKKLPLNIDATISLAAPYNSKGSLVYKKDKIIVESFSFKDKQIKTDFEVDICELSLYKAAFGRPLYGPLRIVASHSDMLHIKTKSFGGELNASLDKNHIWIDINSVGAKKVAYLFDKDSSIESGIIDGVANYNIKEKKADTEIVIRDVTISGIDIDKKLQDIDDLLGLNIINISKSIFLHYYDGQTQETKISQLQLDLSLKDNNIKLDDLALKTQKFLIVIQGDLEDNGDIKKLDVSIVDKNGCAIVTQALSGNIREPKIANTTSTLVNIVKSVPTSILDTANKIVDFGASSVDGIASFGFNQIFRGDTNISITSDLISQSRSIIKFGSDMIMPSGCKVIYSGKVIHPANSKKDEK